MVTSQHRALNRAGDGLLIAETLGCLAFAARAWRIMTPHPRPVLLIVVFCVIPMLLAGALITALRASTVVKINAGFSLVAVYVGCYIVELIVGIQRGLPEWRVRDTARRAGFPFDSRSVLAVVQDFGKAGITAVPPLTGPELRSRESGQAGAALEIRAREVVPLTAGVSRMTTVFCNEFGPWVLYRSDERGFNNPPGMWDVGPIDVALVGDSFVHGACVPPEATLAGRLRLRFPRTVSLGIRGSGPLLQLGVMREYLPELHPRLTVWFFYEGNDLADLSSEAEDPFLLRYLDTDFRQNFSGLLPQIDSGLSAYIAAKRHDIEIGNTPNKFRTAIPLRFVRTELRIPSIRTADERPDTLFTRVVRQARATVERAGSRLIVVILPAGSRYAPRSREVWSDSMLFDRYRVLRALRSEGVSVVDLIPEFARSPRPADLWWYDGSHLNPEGYALVVKTVLNSLPAEHP